MNSESTTGESKDYEQQLESTFVDHERISGNGIKVDLSKCLTAQESPALNGTLYVMGQVELSTDANRLVLARLDHNVDDRVETSYQLISGNGKRQTIPSDGTPLIVGRRVNGNPLGLDRTASREHMSISLSDDDDEPSLTLYDNSTNGTFFTGYKQDLRPDTTAWDVLPEELPPEETPEPIINSNTDNNADGASRNREQSVSPEALGLPNSFSDIRHETGHSAYDVASSFVDSLAQIYGSMDRLARTNPLNSYYAVDHNIRDSYTYDGREADYQDFVDCNYSATDYTYNEYRSDIAEFHAKHPDITSDPDEEWDHYSKTWFYTSLRQGEPVSRRIYLNPQLEDTVKIYGQAVEALMDSGIAFDAKVANKYPTNGERGRFTEPITIYLGESDADRALGIINQLYADNADSFTNQHCGVASFPLAPGYAVGDEPHGLSGRESLSSHRTKAIRMAYHRFTEEIYTFGYGDTDDFGYASHTVDDYKAVFAKHLRQVCEDMGIDPDNIAFDTVDHAEADFDKG